jgi:predicted anti-sigma-YlaC factor YlaD
MKHLAIEELIDFANHVVPMSRKAEMEEHLQSCGRCAKAVSQWQQVRQHAAAEANYQPPQEAVRIAKAAFAGLQLALRRKRASNPIDVLFDSLLQPTGQGFRSPGAGSRQLLYRADPFQIDLQIEVQPGNNRVIVTGQLLGLREPQIAARNVGLIIANLRGRVVRTVTNQFGEFRAEMENSGDLELVFYGADQEPVVIPLRHALGQASNEERKHSGKSKTA